MVTKKRLEISIKKTFGVYNLFAVSKEENLLSLIIYFSLIFCAVTSQSRKYIRPVNVIARGKIFNPVVPINSLNCSHNYVLFNKL